MIANCKIIKKSSSRICYMVMPDGLKEDLYGGLENLSERYDFSAVIVNNVDWNDDLTPWPAVGVFKKEKPFGGHAARFLDKLTKEIVPEAEKYLEVDNAERTIVGVSLSGLFAIWTGFNTDVFTNIISISGSLWYDNFVDWMRDNKLSPNIKNVCMLLGEKEKNAKDKRMSTVEKMSQTAAEIMRKNNDVKVTFEIVEGTHFSPIIPRLQRAVDLVFGL